MKDLRTLLRKAQSKKSTSSLYRRFERVMEIIDFRWTHIVPHPKKEDKNTIAICQHAGPELPKRIRCTWCREEDESLSTRHFGGHKVFEMNKTQWGQVFGLHGKLGRTCIHMAEDKDGNPDPETFCGQDVYPVEYRCSNSECAAVVLDDDAISSKSDAALSKYTDFPHECEECGKEDFLEEVSVCESSEHEPVRATLFNKAVEFTITGEEKEFTNGEGNKQKYTKKDFSFDTGQSFSYIEADIEDEGFNEDQVTEILAPWNLDERYLPERKDRKEFGSDEEYVEAVLSSQAESLSKGNPYGTSGSASTPFGGSTQGKRSFGRR